MFPRLRGPVDEYGNPKIGGGAPEAGETENREEKKQTPLEAAVASTEKKGEQTPLEAAAEKTEKQTPLERSVEATERRETPRPATMSPTEIEDAIKNRKPVHTPFDVTEGANETIKRDTEMPKHPGEPAQGAADDTQGDDLSYDNKNDEHHVTTIGPDGNKIGELVAKDNAPGTVEVTSNQIYDAKLQGKGRGTKQINHLLDNLSEDVHTVKSDISTTKQARGAWEKVMKDNPDAVTKRSYKDGQTQYTVDMDKYREGGTGPGGEQNVGSAQAGTKMAKGNPLTPKQLQERLPDLAQQHLSEDENEATEFNPEKFGDEADKLNKPGEKKKPGFKKM
jgi:hypothetical protein